MTAEKAEAKEQKSRPETPKSVQEAWRDFKSSLCAFLPEEFWEHRRAARREMLLAMRSLIDAAIERVEQGEGQPRRQAKKIEVE